MSFLCGDLKTTADSTKSLSIPSECGFRSWLLETGYKVHDVAIGIRSLIHLYYS